MYVCITVNALRSHCQTSTWSHSFVGIEVNSGSVYSMASLDFTSPCDPMLRSTVEVPYRGDVKDTILDILGGLRSACTYVGASKLKELSRRTTFIRVTQQLNNVFSS